MAPLPPNSTGRLFVNYIANALQHTAMYRYSGAVAPETSFLEGLDDFFAACGAFMPTDWAFVSWEYSMLGNNFSTPLTGAPTPFVGVGGVQASEKPTFMGLPGRSAGGRRSRLFMLGAAASPVGETGDFEDYRIYGSESTDANDIIFAASQVEFVAIDGQAVFWKDYLNLGYNAYWQRKVRP